MSTHTASADRLGSVPNRSRLYWAIADTLMVARRHVLHIPQVPEQLFAATLSPIMFVLLFRYVFGGAIAVPGESYINFMMAGAFVQAVVGEGMVSGVGLATDLKNGIIQRFRTLPMSPFAVVAGPTIADLIRNLLGIVVMVGVGLAVGFRPEAGVTEWATVLALLLATSFAVSWIGSVLALLVRDPQAVQTVGFTALVPLAFVSSAFVPVDTMPGWLQPFVENQPITVAIDVVRALLIDQQTGASTWQAFAWCGGIVAVCMTISVLLYQRMARS